jgi:SdrD B-like domain
VKVNVFKKNADGTFTAGASDTTKNGGYYRFDGLVAGDYYVQLDPSNWAVGGALEGRRSTSGAAKQANPNTTVESDDNGLTPATLADYAAAGTTKGIISNVVTLGPGKSEPTDETDVPQGQGGENARANMTVDFGVITPKFAVGNYVWLDSNRDGIQDTDAGVNGVTVTVFKSDGTPAGTTTTVNGPDGKPGFYLVDNLLAGSYYAVFSNFPADHVLTGQNAGSDVAKDSDPAITGPNVGRTANFTLDESLPAVAPATDGTGLQAGRVLRTIDAGIYPAFSLGNQVWHDVNNNSVIDGGEQGIDGVTVEVYNADASGNAVGAALATQTTTTGGYYLFTGLVAGDYVVVIPKSNFAAGAPLNSFSSSATTSTGETVSALASTGTDNDDNGTLVTDAASAFRDGVVSSKVTLGPTANAPTGEPATPGHPDTTSDARSNVTVDFGFYTMSLGNMVFVDTNNNGVLDGSETGIGQVNVHLYRDDNNDGVPDSLNSIADTMTLPSGQYLFTGLVAGKYIVEIESPAGHYSSSGTSASYTGPFEPGKGDNTAADSNDHGTTVGNRIRSTTIMLMPGTEPLAAVETSGNAITNAAVDSNTDLTVDFGVVPGASIGNYVWLDNNRNGIQDEAADAGIDGVTVKLLKADGTVAKTTVTGPGPDGQPGFYRFDVIPGDYKIMFDLNTLPEGFVVSPKDAGSNDAKDSDANPTDGMTIVTTLTAGENDPDWDLGIYPTAVAVGNFVWVDTNANGLQDDGPTSGIAGVKVTLCDSNGNEVTKDIQGNPIAPVTTDAAGQYLFSNLKPGTYTVKFEAPAGYAPTRSTIGDDTTKDSNGLKATSKALKGGQSDLTLDLGLVKPVSIGNYVWIDKNNDGIQNDGADAGRGGVTATVYDAITGELVKVDAFGKPVVPVKTDANGKYVFVDLLPGKYTVKFTDLPGGYIITKTNVGDPAADSNGLSATSAALASDESDMTLDLGLYLIPLTISPVRVSSETPAAPAAPAPATSTTAAPADTPAGPVSAPVAPLAGEPAPVKDCISGVVYLDGDRSQVKGSNELGRPGVKVNLLDKSGKLLQSTVSDERGTFCFKAAPGDYIVEIIPPAELGATTPIRRNVSVLANGVEGPVASFGLATAPADLALTGGNVSSMLQVASALLLAGLGLSSVRRRKLNK